MALTYNLSKVNELSDNDPDFARQIVILFMEEVPPELKNIKEGFKENDHKRVYQAAHKIKPTLDLLGIDQGYEDVLAIEAWTKTEGKKKEIKEVVKSLRHKVKQAMKELKKDFEL